MKWCVTGFLLLVLFAGVQLSAQETKVDPAKKFAEVKAKAESRSNKTMLCKTTNWLDRDWLH